MWLRPSQHQISCFSKDDQRTRQLAALYSSYADTLTENDSHILSLSLAEIVASCSSGHVLPSVIRETYLKKAVAAHAATNCITDFLPDNSQPRENNMLPFLGVPISIKDCLDIEGHDTTLAYSRNVNRPAQSSSIIVRMLLAAGAILHVKTAVPTGFLSLETSSDLYGYTTNPYSKDHSVGASTGGGAALLAFGGSKIEIGTDVAGSVRLPAHFCGIYSLKASSGRFPVAGSVTCWPGMAIQTLVSPMAANLDDLEEFCHRFIDLKPWEQDSTCIPIPWRPCDLNKNHKTLKFGVIRDDGIVPPTPACLRALNLTIDALKKQGHEVVDFHPPSPLKGAELALRISSSAGTTSLVEPLRVGESFSPAFRGFKFLTTTPLWIKRFVASLLRTFSRPRGRNEALALLLPAVHPCNTLEQRQLIVQKDEYSNEWLQSWNAEELDFVLTVPFPTPAIPRGTTDRVTLLSTGYTSLFNLVDYTAGVLPVTVVDKGIDALPQGFSKSSEYARMNSVAQNVFGIYDSKSMHGLPVGVQVVGRRLEEEKVLAGMKVVRAALAAAGIAFKPRNF